MLEQLCQFDYHGCSNKITFTYKGSKFVVSFSTLSRVVENQLQTQFNFKESLFCVESGIHSNSYREKPSEVLPKEHDQKIKQLHEVRNQKK